MKPRIQATLVALLLAVLMIGCGPTPPPCSSKDGRHTWSDWSVIGTSVLADNVIWHERHCETCGWSERSRGQ